MIEVDVKKLMIPWFILLYLLGVLACIFLDGTISIFSFTKGFFLYLVFFTAGPYLIFLPFYLIETWTENQNRIARARIAYDEYFFSPAIQWVMCTFWLPILFPMQLWSFIHTGMFLYWPV